MSRFDPPARPAEAYDEFWTAAEAGLDDPPAGDPPADPDDTYASFHAAADE
jgi:hypothetical protein